MGDNTSQNPCTLVAGDSSKEDKNSISEMQAKLMIVIWQLMNCENPHNYKSLREKWWLETIDEATKEIAEQYVLLITNYIDQAILEAESILPTFFNLQ